ncbi:unnamed protein product [Pseudo-nitzschia multistriata]|uniref:Copper transport protein n=1 Tax=Pseudo-nitzschia multistriata TaxID=183589 RepID=A0A448Z559_9STRA|nr:unnamed protein product [Pseudo-nitzschia multistriata]
MEFVGHTDGMHDHGMHMQDHDHMHTDAMEGGSYPSGNLFCDDSMGGMVMYMEGFHWTLAGHSARRNCLNFLFESWTLNTVPRFVAAMVCTFFLGVFAEGIACWQHQAETPSRGQQRTTTLAGTLPRLKSVCLRAGGILAAYTLMLVVMTYSLELLGCVVSGLAMGYFVFGGETYRHGGGTPCCGFLEHRVDTSPSRTSENSNSSASANQDGLTERLLPPGDNGSIDIGNENHALDGAGAERNSEHSCCHIPSGS